MGIKHHCILFASVLLAACGTNGNRSDIEFDLVPNTNIVSKNSTDIDSVLGGNVISRATSQSVIGVISSSRLPALASIEGLKDFRPNRAFAYGYPKQCGGSFHAWNYRTELRASSAAIAGCHRFRTGYEDHVEGNCSCRLALVNHKLLVNANELDAKLRYPVVMFLKRKNNSSSEIMLGTIDTSGQIGQNLPMNMYNNKNKHICSGTYSFTVGNALFGGGEFSAKCFDGELTVQGELRAKRIRVPALGGSTTVVMATGETDGGERLAFALGLPYKILKEYPDILEQVSD
jgi:hypothetical protein